MTAAAALIQEVESMGVKLMTNGLDLVLKPAGKIPPELKTRLREHKPELLTLLRDETDLRESMKRMEGTHVSVAVLEDGTMRVITSDADASQALTDGFAVYSPADCWHYVQLQPAERALFRGFKNAFRGGLTEWQAKP